MTGRRAMGVLALGGRDAGKCCGLQQYKEESEMTPLCGSHLVEGILMRMSNMAGEPPKMMDAPGFTKLCSQGKNSPPGSLTRPAGRHSSGNCST